MLRLILVVTNSSVTKALSIPTYSKNLYFGLPREFEWKNWLTEKRSSSETRLGDKVDSENHLV